jgi:hypothetical protein
MADPGFAILNPVHLIQWGTQIGATQVTSKAANLRIHTAIENNDAGTQAIQVVSGVLDPAGKTLCCMHLRTDCLNHR